MSIPGPYGFEKQSAVRYFGEHGSFTYEAAIQLFPDNVTNFRHHGSVEEIVDFLMNDTEAVGVIPMENSNTKLVGDSADALMSGQLEIIGEAKMPITLDLMGFAFATDEVREAHSHHKALRQAYHFLKDRGIKPVESGSTSQAVREIVEKEIPHIAAIGSGKLAMRHSAKGLRVIAGDIADERHNSTRFLVVRWRDITDMIELRDLGLSDMTEVRATALVTPRAKTSTAFTGLFDDNDIRHVITESRPVSGHEGFFGHRVFLVEMRTQKRHLARLGRDKRLSKVIQHLDVVGVYPPATMLQ
ncbi:MAG TPA: prephenate dehydratase domain-containing protein [Candidatus Saccharimonadales bacterium]|nr:prephenate dehydratase domain-containing protein [Candidatus Saccharimonadales bacterium]